MQRWLHKIALPLFSLFILSLMAWGIFEIFDSGSSAEKETAGSNWRQAVPFLMTAESIVAAGKEPASLVSEVETNEHAQRYAAARMLLTNKAASERSQLALRQLTELRTALYQWDEAVYKAAGFCAWGGTLYGHLLARSSAETEDLLAEVQPVIPASSRIQTAPVKRLPETDSALRRIATISIQLPDEMLREVESTGALQELEQHKAALFKAWMELDEELQTLPPEVARRVAPRALKIFDIIAEAEGE